MALPVVTVGHLDLNHKLKVICKTRRNSQQQIKCKCISNINTKCFGGNMLNKYWIEKLERGKQIREDNKELAIQVIEDLIIEYEQKVEGYVASKQIHTCTDQIQLLSFRPWDFLCGLRIGRTFQNQIRFSLATQNFGFNIFEGISTRQEMNIVFNVYLEQTKL